MGSGFSTSAFSISLLVSTTSGLVRSLSKYRGLSNVGMRRGDFLYTKNAPPTSEKTATKTSTAIKPAWPRRASLPPGFSVEHTASRRQRLSKLFLFSKLRSILKIVRFLFFVLFF